MEIINLGTEEGLCQPLQLESPTSSHSSVATNRGVMTCGGQIGVNYLKSCIIQTKDRKRMRFPSLNRGRSEFGMAVMGQSVIVVGGNGAINKMEKISLNGKKWVEEDLPFKVRAHCVVPINDTMMMVIGGNNGTKVNKWF